MFPTANNQTQTENPPELVMLQMIHSYWVFLLIYAAAKLGIADLLKNEALNCDKLASLTQTHPRSLSRLMRALASVGIFEENQQGDFALTPLSNCLLSDAPSSVRAGAIMLGEEHYRAWGDILYSMRTGKSAFENLYGMNVFEYYAQNPEPEQIFSEAMTSVSIMEDMAVTKAYDFSKIQKLVDVGGGHGGLIASILKSNPHLQGVLFDQPSVVDGANNVLEKYGVSSRCEILSGNFFESVPSGGDAYILKHVLHDWDDETSISILKNCHQAMKKNDLLLIIELVIPPGNLPFFGKLQDINMLIMSHGGCERTQVEYQKLFECAGFKLTNIFPTEADTKIIEGICV